MYCRALLLCACATEPAAAPTASPDGPVPAARQQAPAAPGGGLPAPPPPAPPTAPPTRARRAPPTTAPESPTPGAPFADESDDGILTAELLLLILLAYSIAMLLLCLFIGTRRWTHRASHADKSGALTAHILEDGAKKGKRDSCTSIPSPSPSGSTGVVGGILKQTPKTQQVPKSPSAEKGSMRSTTPSEVVLSGSSGVAAIQKGRRVSDQSGTQSPADVPLKDFVFGDAEGMDNSSGAVCNSRSSDWRTETVAVGTNRQTPHAYKQSAMPIVVSPATKKCSPQSRSWRHQGLRISQPEKSPQIQTIAPGTNESARSPGSERVQSGTGWPRASEAMERSWGIGSQGRKSGDGSKRGSAAAAVLKAPVSPAGRGKYVSPTGRGGGGKKIHSAVRDFRDSASAQSGLSAGRSQMELGSTARTARGRDTPPRDGQPASPAAALQKLAKSTPSLNSGQEQHAGTPASETGTHQVMGQTFGRVTPSLTEPNLAAITPARSPRQLSTGVPKTRSQLPPAGRGKRAMGSTLSGAV